MAKHFNANYNFNQHLEQPTGNDQEDENVNWEALQSTSSKDVVQELENAFIYLLNEKYTLHHRNFITHRAK